MPVFNDQLRILMISPLGLLNLWGIFFIQINLVRLIYSQIRIGEYNMSMIFYRCERFHA